MRKNFLLGLMLIGLASCQKPINNYEEYVSQLEIDSKLRNQSRDISHADHNLFSANSTMKSATFFKPGTSFYSQSEVDEAKKKLKKAQDEYADALEVYYDALKKIVDTLAEEPTDTVEYRNEIAVTTYKISENDYNYYQSKLKKIKREIEENRQ